MKWVHHELHFPVLGRAVLDLFLHELVTKRAEVCLPSWGAGGASCRGGGGVFFLCCCFPRVALSLTHQICLHRCGLLRRIVESAQVRAFCLA